ncbi:MAG: RNA 2',3'-cyclic phosphodiesterase [Gammaproteobacteria bacterium]|nr:RNA 2',3'-cyclic phosphodiesterase [Gammaproteobacteria bacterium]
MAADRARSVRDSVERERRRRVFFALWPDEDTREALVRASRFAVERSAGRATPRANLHVTLVFLGAVSAAELARLRQIPPPPAPRFVLPIDTLGFRSRARLLWAAPGTVPPALLELESWLWSELAELGISRERRAYLPHVTLARRARHVGETLTPVRWPVAEFVLVESSPGARSSVYEILESWPLK